MCPHAGPHVSAADAAMEKMKPVVEALMREEDIFEHGGGAKVGSSGAKRKATDTAGADKKRLAKPDAVQVMHRLQDVSPALRVVNSELQHVNSELQHRAWV